VLAARNFMEWGDPLAVGALERNLAELIAAGMTPQPGPGIAHYYASELPRLFASGLAVAYGAINFRYGDYLWIGAAATWLVGAGLALSLLVRSPWPRVERRPLVILLAGFALFFATYFYPGYRYRWLQVRYFFNQLPLLSLGAAIGIIALADGARRLGLDCKDRALVALVYGCLLGLNLLVLVNGVLPHLYRHVGSAP
jgi:branched-subunit amino acid ABC-type transport system permease component